YAPKQTNLLHAFHQWLSPNLTLVEGEHQCFLLVRGGLTLHHVKRINAHLDGHQSVKGGRVAATLCVRQHHHPSIETQSLVEVLSNGVRLDGCSILTACTFGYNHKVVILVAASLEHDSGTQFALPLIGAGMWTFGHKHIGGLGGQ